MSLYDDASLIMYPSGYKEDKIYSLKPTDGSGDLTFTRASTATRVNAEGLIEGVRTNLFLQSNNFSTTWGKSAGVTLTGGQPDPFGGTDAFLVNLGTSVGNSISQSLSLVSGEYTMSAYIKGVDLTSLRMIVAGNSSVLVTSQIVNGTWVRVVLTGTLGSTGFVSNQIARSDNALNQSFYIYGAQLELSPSVTEYIPTTTTAVSVGMLADVPRIDYTGGGCGKLLLEGQRTNLVTYSEDFSNAAWAKQDSTITSNAAISPDGTTNADLYTTTSDLYDFVRQSITYISGTSYTISVFVKQGTSSEISLFLPSQAFGSNQSVTFDVSDGTYTITSGSPSVTIEDYGNGWYRCALSATATISATRSTGFSSVASGAVTTLYLYGAQLEAGSYVSSYIPTLASSVTRLADAASKTGISSLIGQTEGTLFADVDFNGVNESVSQTSIFVRTAGANTGYVFINFYQGKINVGFRVAGSTLFDILIGSTLSAGRYKIAFAYKSGDIAFYVNGSLIDTRGSTFGTTSFSEIYLGGAIGNQLGDGLNQAQLYTTRLSNAELATLTTL